jgi:hypothetical protein
MVLQANRGSTPTTSITSFDRKTTCSSDQSQSATSDAGARSRKANLREILFCAP